MDNIFLKARAKINPSLDVIGVRDDGYHMLEMIMQSINLCDTVFIKKTTDGEITLKTNHLWIPTDERNLVYKMAKYIKEKYKIKDGIYIDLHKVIPVSAGLAGGSSDCAATLIALRNLFRLPISPEELLEIGGLMGSDIPFCLLRGTYLAQGIGDKLKKLPDFPFCYVVLIKPNFNASTPSVYKELDSVEIKNHPDTEKIIHYITKGDLKGICDNMVNVLELVTIKNCPVIQDIKEDMLSYGALGSLMSGSGSSVFGLFDDKQKAQQAFYEIRKKYKSRETYLTTTFNLPQ